MSGKSYILVVAVVTSIVLRVQGIHAISVFFVIALIFLLYKNKQNVPLLVTSVVIFTFFFINPYYFKKPPPIPTNNELTGKIISIPKFDGNKISFKFKTNDKQKVEVNYFAKTENELNDLTNLKYGLNCSIEGNYERPPQPRNFYSFNYREYLELRKIYFQFKPRTISSSNCQQSSFSLYTLLQNYRQSGIEYIKENFPEGSQGIVAALIFGDRGEIGHELIKAYQSLGIIHLLAVSGLHVGLVSATIYWIFIRIGMTKERTIDILLILLPIYAILAGGAPSVLRAVSMAMVVLFTMKMNVKLSPIDGISLICLALLFINPSYLFHLGFQLSFLVSYSLIISSSTLLQRYSSWIVQLATVTVIAQIVSFPIIIYHFYEISILSLPLNLIYIPFITFFALPLSFLLFIGHYLFAPFVTPLLIVFDFVIVFAHSLLAILIDLSFSTYNFGKPPLFLIVFYYLAIFWKLLIWEKSPLPRQMLNSISLFFIVVLFHWYYPYLTNEGEITMIDVGQGESIYIELPRRQAVYIIDTGGNVNFSAHNWATRNKPFDVGEDILLPFLKAKGVRKIDKLILTHGHFDHIGGAKALVGKIRVQNLLYGIGPVEGVFERELLSKFYHEGTNIQFVKKGDYWNRSNYDFFVLSPVGGEESLNDRSIVIYTNIGGLNWLFTGDLEEAGERQLLSNFNKIDVDVLKVGHHGSNTSTTDPFLQFVDPSIALIPVGQRNLYGHPHQEVISRLKENEITIFRTDYHGAIRYRYKKDQGIFETVLTDENN